jgi:uncharacterized membrane protein
MKTGLILTLSLLAIVIAWVIVKVAYYARLSERQWQKVDKSKLRPWDDEDD